MRQDPKTLSAYPLIPPQDTAAGIAVGYPYPEPGMTLRDYFAAKTLQGLLACGTEFSSRALPTIAAASYEMADAMLSARVV